MVALKRPLNVLVVDDDDGVRDSVACVVSGLGHRPLGAPDGESALRLARSCFPDFSILDVHIAADNGLVILGNLRRIHSTLPAIFISADLRPEFVEEATDQGVDRFLEKPLDVERLRAEIRGLIAFEKL